MRSAPQPLQCKSPSTDSTTSLAQLREKLTILSPIEFNKVPAKIAVPPGLAAVNEQDEYDRLSNREYRPRCGVFLKKKYHSDSETLTVTKKTRYLEPVVEEHSASLALVAALGTTDQSILDETFDELYRKNPHIDLADLLIEEAIKHGQDKDSGIISGKNTQESDIIEDTPVEEPARRIQSGLSRKPTHIEDNKYSTDDSDVVDDTPRCSYLSKKVKAKSDKANKSNNDEIEALNDESVDKYFCQQTQHLNNLISPATIKKNCENISLDDIKIYEKENNEVNLAIDVHIIDCVNNLLDKVCYNLDYCRGLLEEQDQEIDCLGVAKNNISKMNKKIPKSTKDTLHEHDGDGAKRVTLKFNAQIQAPKMNANRQNKSKRIIHPKIVEEDTKLKASTKTKSPTNNEKQLILKKRKLYSPNNDDFENQDLRTRKVPRESSTTESPIAACYKELENARKSRIRLPRKRTSSQSVISPKTKKLNDMFDQIKDNIVNDEKITLVDKKSEKDLYVYNMSSESDDEAFKKKNIQVQKRVSSSSLESTSKHRRSVKPVNYTSEDECQRVLKPKAVKQTKPRNRNVKKVRRTNLTDERMRTQRPETLETSFVQENCDTFNPDEPEPALQMPVLEAISPDDFIDEPIISENKPQTPKNSDINKMKTEKRLKKKCEKLTKPTNKSKEIVTNVAREIESATVSPLPGLVVETEPRKDDLTSSLDANLFQKLKNIYTEVDDLSTTRDTQNLLLNNNIDEIGVNMLNEIGDGQNLSINQSKCNDNAPSTEKIQTMDLSEVLSEKSIPTCGGSPITGHNNSDECPPNLDAIYESFQHRDVDIEGRNRSIVEFLINMRNQTINSKASPFRGMIGDVSVTRMSPKDSVRSNVGVSKQPVKSNAKQIYTPADIRSDKTELRTKKIEILSFKDTTRTSTKDSARSVLAADKLPQKSNPKPIHLSPDASSGKSNPRVLLERMSSEDIESLRNPVTPKSKTSASRVSEKYGKIVTPNHSNTTGSSVPVLKIHRVSSDEINRWLPMPATEVVEEAKNSKIIRRKRKSVSKPCTTCEQLKQVISPVKLNFNVEDLTSARVTRSKTRSIKSMRSRTDIDKLRTENKSAKGREIVAKSSKGTADLNPTEMTRSIASVESWIQSNAAAESKPGDNDNTREIYERVMETLETRLVEINEANGEAMQAHMLKTQEETRRVYKEVDSMVRNLKAKMEALMKSEMDRACALIRADAENKVKMVLQLKEDIKRILK